MNSSFYNNYQPAQIQNGNVGQYPGNGYLNRLQYPHIDNSFQPVGSPRIPGKFISNINEIAANEVPMDGSISTFVMQDLSSIVLKQWNAQGSIDTAIYDRRMPDQKPSEVPVNQELIQQINDRFDNIEKLLNEFKKHNAAYKKTRKEGDIDESV